MPVRVELIDEAVEDEDLVRYAATGTLPLFLKKLIRLEEVGEEAGRPLGGGLTGWRKIVVGDRDWRIISTMDTTGTTATVWVIGDRDDAACYAEASRRVEALGKDQPQATSLAAVMSRVSEAQRAAKQRRDRASSRQDQGARSCRIIPLATCAGLKSAPPSSPSGPGCSRRRGRGLGAPRGCRR